MSLPDAAAEFARQLVTALAGDAGREQREHERGLEELTDRAERAELERDRLRGAVQTVLASESDLLSTERAELLRDALGEPVGPDREPVTVERLNAALQRDDLLAAARDVINGDLGKYEEVADLAHLVARIEREID